MAKPTVQKEYRHFGGGLITEASPLTFPENTAVDIQNLVLKYDGTVQRRKGLDYVAGSAGLIVGKLFFWDVSAKGGGVYVLEVFTDQYMMTIKIISVNSSGVPTTLLNTYYIYREGNLDGTFGTGDQDKIDISSINNVAIITQKGHIPISITDNRDGTFSIYNLDLGFRDLEGEHDEYSLSTNPTVTTAKHTYNLKNQGWTSTQITAYNALAGNPYPALNQSPHVGWRPATNTVNEAWDAAQVRDYVHGTNQTTAGKFVRKFCNMTNDRARISPINNLTVSSVTYNNGTGTWTVTTAENHNLAVADKVYFENLVVTYVDASWGRTFYYFPDKMYVTTTPSGTQFTARYAAAVGYYLPDYSSGFTVVNAGRVYAEVAPTLLSYGDVRNENMVPACSTTFAGRVWYAGFSGARRSSAISVVPYSEQNVVAFSKLLTKQGANSAKTFDLRMQECFQENDPTSREFNDLLPTDGGYIKISDADKILHIEGNERSVLVFANNGVWEIGPGSQGYFTANSYTINKVSNEGLKQLTPSAAWGYQAKASLVTNAEGLMFYVGRNDDVYVVSRDQQSGRFFAQNLTETTIRSALKSKTVWKLHYYQKEKLMYAFCTDNKTMFVFDLRLKAWYKHYLGYNVYEIFSAHSATYDRLYMASTAGVWEFTNADFQDNGVDAAAYVVTGYELLNVSSRDKQAVYITTHFNRTETQFVDDGFGDPEFNYPSGCMMKAQWDFDLTGDAGKHSAAQEVYRLLKPYVAPAGPYPKAFDYGYGVISTKNKVRGSGKALCLRFDTEAGKDMQLLGWSTSYTGNAKD